MAYNATGEWQDEDAGVQNRVAGMLKTDSSLMQAARADAMKTGNKRGLLNSSMTAQAGTRAGLDVVVPIASQEAGQIAARNLSGQGFKQEGMLQGKRIESSEKIVGIQEAGQTARLGQELATRTTIAGDDRAARSSDLLKELTSRETVAGADRTARSSDLGRELTSREGIAGADRTARSGDLRTEITSREGMATADRMARTSDMDADRRAANTRAAAELTSRENIAGNDRTAASQNAVATAVSHVNTTYTNGYNAIMSNPNIPEAARGTHLAHLAARRDSDLILVESLYGVNLNWEVPSGTTGTPTPVTNATTNQTYPNDFNG